METTPSGDRPRCISASMDNNGQHLSLPTMESDSTDSPEVATRQSRSNTDNTILAVGSLVPNSEVNGHSLTNSDTQESGQAASRKRPSHSGSQSPLESLGMASKRAALSVAGLSEGVRGFILGNKAALTTQKRYLPAQEDFLDWLKEGSFEAGINPTVPIINWLHHSMATRNLAWNTVMNMKSAILALFADTRCITNDPLYQQFIRAGRVETIHHTRQEDYDISPV
ncbi:hypothetical protein BGX26_005791, partial [Mortierella sp. AD094]